jgi:hypothetical protein
MFARFLKFVSRIEKSTVYKPGFRRPGRYLFQPGFTHVAEEWAASMIAWATVCAVAITVVCILFAPAE